MNNHKEFLSIKSTEKSKFSGNLRNQGIGGDDTINV